MRFYKFIIKKIISLSILLILIFTLTGCNLKTEKEESLNDKVDEEMQYVNTEVLTMLNSLNNITVKNYSVVTKKSNQLNSSSGTEEGTSEENEKSGSESSSDSEQSTRRIFWKFNCF